MSIVDNINELKEVGLYSYCDYNYRDIEINFNVNEPNNYKLEISNKELTKMKGFTKLGLLLKAW
ncbi:hypothetical protein [Clostridium sp. CCUG 7971]|uniref:hypothetical protein n=1 Tax=Clostridium sp. CCUG 7971 TaxID=2811414 RepID=UPI001ABAB715|nr:hypothetical protein [Clostridium sp. CCUG 7971]MBO3443398.1 hypothetical protein [Clostridium sp. CCUG 7971]